MNFCDTVVYKQGDGEFHYNSSRFHPAVVTKVNDDESVNLHVFFDGEASQPMKNVPLGHVDSDNACCMDYDTYYNETNTFPTSGDNGG